MIEMIEMLLALWVLPSLLTLALMLLMLFGGLVMILTQLQWIGDLQVDVMGIGIRNRGIWIMSTPALVVFAAMMFVPLRTARPARFGFGDDANG